MLAELVKAIGDLARKAQGIETHKDPLTPERTLVRSGDKFEWVDAPAPKRMHSILSFADLASLAKDKAIAENPEIYHSASAIVVLLDREKRRELVTMPLTHSSRWQTLVSLSKGQQGMTTADAVKLIRFELHGAGADALCAALRKVDFTRTGNGARTVEHGRESLGTSVEAAVQGVSEIPQEFTAQVPVWGNQGLRVIQARVRCGVYLDVNNQSVQIKPLADEISNALEAAQGELHALLATAVDPIPVLQGEVKLVG